MQFPPKKMCTAQCSLESSRSQESRMHLRPWDQRKLVNAAYIIPFLQIHIGTKALKRPAEENLVYFV